MYMIFFQYLFNLMCGEYADSQDTGEAVFNELDEIPAKKQLANKYD